MLFHPDLVPAFQAVYHDYTICNARLSGKFMDFAEEYAYADKSGRTNVEEVAVLGFRNLAFGIHPGVIRVDVLEYSPEAAAIAKCLGRAWLDNQKYVLFGQTLRPPEVLSGNGTITTGFPFRDSTKHAYPAIRAGAFRAMDDTVAVIVTNAATTALAPEIAFDAAKYGFDAPCVRLVDRADKSEVYAGPASVRFRLPIEGRSARAFEVVPAEKVEAKSPSLPSYVVWSDNMLLEMAAGSTADVWFNLENTTGKAATARITIEAPETWSISPAAETTVSLPPNSVQKAVFNMTLPKEATGRQTLSYKVHIEGEGALDVSQSVVFGAKPYVATQSAGKKCHRVPYLKEIPAGRLPESVPVLNDLKEKMIGNGKASPTTARLAWSETGLVMEFAVQDETPHEPTPGTNVWQGDCIQIGLGFPRIEKDAADYYLQTELYLAIVGGKPFVSCLNKAYDEYLKVEASRQDGTTFYRLTVPKELLREVFKGKKYPFNFTVNEHDGDNFAGWQEWTPGICGGKNPGAWGELLLAE